jgi:acetyl/propionyl-CoA carboxylase alpha subunit
VEHPVTEFVTGVDLVRWQLRIAAGEQLTLRQEDLRQTGHALECRIYAEDPANQFMPAPGRVLFAREPAGPGVRNDSSIFSGLEVTPDYDPILSKLITWGVDREHARRRMVVALRELVVLGIPTTAPFLADLLEHPSFVSGETHTDFIATHFAGWGREEPGKEEAESVPWAVLAAAGLDSAHPAAAGRRGSAPGGRGGPAPDSPWVRVGSWQVGERIARSGG